jgi:hypothetical protein
LRAMDIVFLALGGVFFALAWAIALGFDRL